MFQPEVKWKFVERYCNPKNGWEVFVDIDPSELGTTGGPRTSEAARVRQLEMQTQGEVAISGLRSVRAHVGGSRAAWMHNVQSKYPGVSLPKIPGDRDVIAINPIGRKLIVAEAEGDSAGQPEQKLYKAIGQIVIATGETVTNGYMPAYVLIINGERMKTHTIRANALQRLEISAVYINKDERKDEWLFGG